MRLLIAFMIMAFSCKAQVDTPYKVKYYPMEWAEGKMYGSHIDKTTNSSDSTEIGKIHIHGDTMNAIRSLIDKYDEIDERYQALKDVASYINLEYFGRSNREASKITGKPLTKEQKEWDKWYNKDYKHYLQVEKKYKR